MQPQPQPPEPSSTVNLNHEAVVGVIGHGDISPIAVVAAAAAASSSEPSLESKRRSFSYSGPSLGGSASYVRAAIEGLHTLTTSFKSFASTKEPLTRR
jgi:hypothetical protein